jgi:hypothetical protein
VGPRGTRGASTSDRGVTYSTVDLVITVVYIIMSYVSVLFQQPRIVLDKCISVSRTSTLLSIRAIESTTIRPLWFRLTIPLLWSA